MKGEHDKIRTAMVRPDRAPLRGTVEVDEIYVGGTEFDVRESVLASYLLWVERRPIPAEEYSMSSIFCLCPDARQHQLVRVIALLAVVVAVAPARLTAQDREWAGCYDLELAPWTRPVEGGDTLYYTPPPRVYLDTARASYPWDPDVREVEPAPGSPPSVHRYTVWDPFHADSVALTWSTGFTGVTMRLGREGQALRGRAITFIDVSPYEPHTANVLARPVSCDAPMPPEHASWRRFPREVPLQTGHTLPLGEPLPREGLALEHDRRNTYWVRHRPAGLFSGATHARVGMDQDGIVRRVEVFFNPDVGVDSLEAHLASALGPPTGRRMEAEDGWISWFGREGHRLSLRRHTTTDRKKRLMITITGG